MGRQSGCGAAGGGQRSGQAYRPWSVAAQLAVIVAVGMLAGGCGSRPLFGEVLRQPNSYDYKGEQVELHMLEGGDLWDYAVTGQHQKDLRDRLKAEFPAVFTDDGFNPPAAGQMRAQVAGIAAVVPLIAGFAVDAVRSELEKEAGIHEAQFGRAIHESGFWKELAQEMPATRPARLATNGIASNPPTPLTPPINGATPVNGGDPTNPTTKPADADDVPRRTFGTPRWLGFEIVRTTAATRDPKSPVKYASRIVCVMVPAPYMQQPTATLARDENPKTVKITITDPLADSRLFVIKPLLYEVRTSKAKLMRWEKMLTATVNIGLDATWIDDRQTVHQAPVAAAEFEIEDYDVKNRPIYINELKGQIAGWFGGVPVSTEPGHPEELSGNGTFRLAVAVTERDPSRVKESIERAAKYLKDNKSQIVQQISGTK